MSEEKDKTLQPLSRLERLQLDGPASKSPEDCGDWLLAQIRIAVEDGVPEPKDGETDSLDKFWNGIPTPTEEAYGRVIDRVVLHPDFPSLREGFLERFGVDLRAREIDYLPTKRVAH